MFTSSFRRPSGLRRFSGLSRRPGRGPCGKKGSLAQACGCGLTMGAPGISGRSSTSRAPASIRWSSSDALLEDPPGTRHRIRAPTEAKRSGGALPSGAQMRNLDTPPALVVRPDSVPTRFALLRSGLGFESLWLNQSVALVRVDPPKPRPDRSEAQGAGALAGGAQMRNLETAPALVVRLDSVPTRFALLRSGLG